MNKDKAAMLGKERFCAVCSFVQPDRFPIDYLAHPSMDSKLKQFYKVSTEKELL